MFTADEIVDVFHEMQISHVVWIPDSEIGKWETQLDASSINVVRVCREGEAWPLAAGLAIGGAKPIVLLQTTGLYESGDALRHVVYDLEMPVYALVGARNWLNPAVNDSAAHFAEPILRAWQLNYVILDDKTKRSTLIRHYQECQSQQRPGVCLMPE